MRAFVSPEAVRFADIVRDILVPSAVMARAAACRFAGQRAWLVGHVRYQGSVAGVAAVCYKRRYCPECEDES